MPGFWKAHSKVPSPVLYSDLNSSAPSMSQTNQSPYSLIGKARNYWMLEVHTGFQLRKRSADVQSFVGLEKPFQVTQ